jgi:hypothetical protein
LGFDWIIKIIKFDKTFTKDTEGWFFYPDTFNEIADALFPPTTLNRSARNFK